MGEVYDQHGQWVGSVNAWSGVYGAEGRKVGHIDIFSSKVYDASGQCVGSADIHGNVYGYGEYASCKVAFFGSDVHDENGRRIGSVGIAGAPEPMPDMQWRGAAALLLLCRNLKPDLERVALRYLLDGTPSMHSQLVKAGQEAVLPLLRAFVKYIGAQGNEVKSESQRQKIKAEQWSEKIMNPHVRPTMEVIAAFGSSGVDGLVAALRDSDRWVQQAASLFLSISEHLNGQVVQEISNLLRAGRVESTAAIMLLTFVLAKGGDPRSQRAITDFSMRNAMNPQDAFLKTIDTAVLEMLGWERGIGLCFG